MLPLGLHVTHVKMHINSSYSPNPYKKPLQKATSPASNKEQPQTLNEADKKIIQELKARDREVRNHEQAHKSAAGPYARGVSFQYQRGPDGINYAVSGEVDIDTSEVPGDPEASFQKAKIILAAALAPANPSSQDYAVAAQARQMADKAQREMLQSDTENSSQKLTGEYKKTERTNQDSHSHILGHHIDLYS